MLNLNKFCAEFCIPALKIHSVQNFEQKNLDITLRNNLNKAFAPQCDTVKQNFSTMAK